MQNPNLIPAHLVWAPVPAEDLPEIEFCADCGTLEDLHEVDEWAGGGFICADCADDRRDAEEYWRDVERVWYAAKGGW
jgi:hypothetical protein